MIHEMDDTSAGPERSEILGRHIEQARAMYQGTYNGRGFQIEPTKGDFAFRYTSVGDGELSLRGNLFGGSMRGEIETAGEYVVTWISSGEGVLDLDGEPVALEHGRPALFVNNRPNEFAFHDHKQNLMHFDGAFLERVAAEHEGAPEGPLLFDTTAMPTGDALRRWGATVATVAKIVYSENASPLLRSEANRAAAVSLLETFPHESIAAPPELTIPGSARLRRAIEFMHANAHLPINVTQIAEAASISPRSLQTTFRIYLELTPLDYLRRIRLDRVREELHAAGAEATVADVAQRWGFAHLGRFAAHYAERFGELPRNTLAD